MLGSMCIRDGKSIFMGKPGRYRFPLLWRVAGRQKDRHRSDGPTAHSSSFLPWILSWLRTPAQPCPLEATSLPDPRDHPPPLPIPPLTLGLPPHFSFPAVRAPSSQPSLHVPPPSSPAWVPPHLSPWSARGVILVKANFLSVSISSKLLTSIMPGKPGA